MAEKGHTSSITSVTEEEMSADSESDTTESSYSNITSSVLSSTDTDDKLTPGLIKISLSNTTDDGNKSSKHRRIHQVEAEKAHDDFENTVLHTQGLSEADVKQVKGESISHNNGTQTGVTVPGNIFPYGSNQLPLSYAKGKGETKHKGGSMHRSDLNHQTPSFVKQKLEIFHENGHVNGKHSKFSTDFSETSSVQLSDRNNNNNEFDEEYTDEGVCSDSKTQTFLPNFSSPMWHQAPCFNRYWSHYRFVMEWYHLHVRAVKSLQAQMFSGWGYPQQWGCTHEPRQGNQGKTRKSRKSRRSRHKRRRKSESSSFSARDQNQAQGSKPPLHRKTTSNRESDEEELEMEITDEMLEFFTTSYRHKIERDKEGEQDPTSSAPAERPGVRRTEEMKELYGLGAPMIQGMETAMQMTFDRFLDRFQPSLWPNMPLKINFA
ncbi:hypothetical protein BsWGS_17787 [Bradybaena similaris]